MMRPRQLNASLAATARYARAVSRSIQKSPGEIADVLKQADASPAWGKVKSRLARLRRTEIPATR